ncbi:hypothetical protein TIFTF001_017062 [Ficus carica]|uniref:Uncharacterized protein n=1 Tax=Ficus carica TaxID=3494 RepID=A0AA88A495_FICCA|nr:hypothetical protein TIFTF001_017062 [Ficus carica]
MALRLPIAAAPIREEVISGHVTALSKLEAIWRRDGRFGIGGDRCHPWLVSYWWR